VMCGDNKGFLHVIDIQKSLKLSTFPVGGLKKIVNITTNGLYNLVTFDDGQVTVHDV
jgi:hypothetical protein